MTRTIAEYFIFERQIILHCYCPLHVPIVFHVYIHLIDQTQEGQQEHEKDN